MCARLHAYIDHDLLELSKVNLAVTVLVKILHGLVQLARVDMASEHLEEVAELI